MTRFDPLLNQCKRHAPLVGRFLSAGLLATLLDLAVFMLLGFVIAGYPKTRFSIAFMTSVLCRFWLDKTYTFKNTSKRHVLQLLSYILSCCVTLLVGVGSFELALLFINSQLAAKLFSIPCVTVAGFFLFRYFVFRP